MLVDEEEVEATAALNETAGVAPLQLLVAYADDGPQAPLTRNVKLYLGPLACNLDTWRAWGLPAAAWRPFADAVHADPAAVDAHAAVLLGAARAGGLAVEAAPAAEEERSEVCVLRLPSVDLRPMAVSKYCVVLDAPT